METEVEQLSGLPLYAFLFGGVFKTIQECQETGTPVIQSPMYSRAVEMMENFLNQGLKQSILEDDVVNWINSEVLDHLKRNLTFESFCEKGYLNLVKWVTKKYKIKSSATPGFKSACKNGQLEVVQFLTEKFPQETSKACTSAFISACGGKNLELVKWLVLTFPQIKVHTDRSAGFLNMCRAESLDILEWFTKKYPDVHQTVPPIAFIEACCDQGSLEMAKFLFEKYPIRKEDLDFAFSKACENGHIDVVKWFLQRGAIVVDRDTYSRVLEEENFEIATLLIEKNCVDKNNAFIVTCSYGELSLAREILVKYPEIDVHVNDDEALRNAVQEGRSEIAKWLMEKYFTEEDNRV